MEKINMIMNPIYLVYNFVRTDYGKLNRYVNMLSEEQQISKTKIWKDILQCLIKYNTLFLDYFYFRFFDPSVDRSIHTNVWDMHKFHQKYNGKNSKILRDKLLFRKHFQKYFNYSYYPLYSKSDIRGAVNWITSNKYTKFVAKDPMGTVGKGVKIINTDEINDLEKYITELYENNFTLLEEYIVQHSLLSQLYPNAINTVRIVTFYNENNDVEIWGTLLRMGVDKSVDNFDAGGLSANIDINSGIVDKPAKVKDPFVTDTFKNHPRTGCQILGLQIPFWNEIISLVKNIAVELDDVRTVGWDIAITEKGPTIVEGNDNWDKTHFELISGIGLNSRIKKLLKA